MSKSTIIGNKVVKTVNMNRVQKRQALQFFGRYRLQATAEQKQQPEPSSEAPRTSFQKEFLEKLTKKKRM